jgi:hypothetical protein
MASNYNFWRFFTLGLFVAGLYLVVYLSLGQIWGLKPLVDDMAIIVCSVALLGYLLISNVKWPMVFVLVFATSMWRYLTFIEPLALYEKIIGTLVIGCLVALAISWATRRDKLLPVLVYGLIIIIVARVALIV